MNVVEISCPAKTFVLGEYGVLDNGPAILFNTAPRFKCHISKGVKKSSIDFSKKSPASQWVKKNPVEFSDVSLEWTDPFNGNGGLGFSAAQFNILYAYSCFLRGDSIEKIQPQKLWRNYREMKFEGWLPSGADVISQWVGGVCVFEQTPLSVESLTATFPEISFFVLKTGDQLNTHEYLKTLNLPDVSDLKQIAQRGVDSMKSKKEDVFIDSIKEYGKALAEKNFITDKTKQILKKLSSIKEIRACKGCGAMGAETIILLFKKEDKEFVRSQILDFEILTDESQLTYGVEFHKTTKDLAGVNA